MYFYRTPGSAITIGKNCRFRSAAWSNLVGLNRQCMICTLTPNAKITIGDGSGMSGTAVSAAEFIGIGSNVLCGANVTITDTDWHNDIRAQKKLSTPSSAPVNIGANVWLGMNVVVLKGVTIGANTVIAANSVVTKNIPENVLAAGQPAKVVRNL
jgi:acetyltransferase-like isoleucine patch superfamily enzyme